MAQRTPRPGTPPRVSNREKLSMRRRRTAKRTAGAAVVALFAAWLLLQARPAAPLHAAMGWLEGALDSANTLANRRSTPPVASQHPAVKPNEGFRPQVPGTDERARARADLRGPEAGSRVEAIATAQTERDRTTMTAAARPAPAAPAPARPAPPREGPAIEPAPAEPSAPEPGDVIGDLVPSDFEGSLGVGVDLGAAAANVVGSVDLDLDEGSVRVETGASVATPAAPVAVSTQIGVAPGEAAVAVTAGVGSLPVVAEVNAGGREIVAIRAGLPAGVLETRVGRETDLIVDLTDAGLPVAASGSIGDDIAVQLPGGGNVAVPVADLLGGLLVRP